MSYPGQLFPLQLLCFSAWLQDLMIWPPKTQLKKSSSSSKCVLTISCELVLLERDLSLLSTEDSAMLYHLVGFSFRRGGGGGSVQTMHSWVFFGTLEIHPNKTDLHGTDFFAEHFQQKEKNREKLQSRWVSVLILKFQVDPIDQYR